jgi:hypothetical protein
VIGGAALRWIIALFIVGLQLDGNGMAYLILARRVPPRF